ncbi:LysR family transcriptional regulator [Marinomonas flavescens]|uniref:LysR family transcriptional regulator n=1 Tax=Marinomonas flavescens TaxID=2529379 RepID=UPI001056B01B|nr:LysR family transcriptional regulator [Marinomonas flavescens]
MKLDQIRAFIAVVETGSFRSAADAIHKAQPSISAAVKTLEAQYDIQLFDRDSYRPTLTTEGKAFFLQSKKLMSQVQQLENLGHDLAQGIEAPLRLCLSQSCFSDPFMARIKAFQASYPELSMDITTDHLYGVHENLLKDKSEIAIGPRYGLDDRHAFTELLQLEIITVIAPELLATLTHKDNRLKPSQLYPIAQVLVNNSALNQSESGHRYVLPTGKRWYVNDYFSKKSLLIHGLGWARIPRYMVKAELESGSLVIIDVENFTSHSQLPIFMIRLRHQTLSYQANLFWEAMNRYS